MHRWGEPVRPDLNNTFRSCSKCGLVKITRHEPDNQPQHWIEFEADGRKIISEKTPACQPAAVMLPITLIVGAAFILRDDLVRRDAIFFVVGAVVGAVGMMMVAGVLG